MAAVNLFHPYPSKKFAAVIAADAHSSFNELLLTKQTSRRREFVDVSEIHDIVLVRHLVALCKIQFWRENSNLNNFHHSPLLSKKRQKSEFFRVFFCFF